MAEEKEVGSKLPFANWLKKKKKKTKENEKIISVETAQTNILYFLIIFVPCAHPNAYLATVTFI